jgi:carbon-monoxide dehydrogenase medium subunit
MPDLREGKISPRCLVDITRIPGLDTIEISDAFVTVGAAVTFADLQKDSFLRQHVHALVEAAGCVGAASIQNAATWVGNIVQAMPAADGAVVALALEAEARVVDSQGARWQPVDSLFQGPGVSTIDSSRQVVSHLRFPRPNIQTGTAWRRVGRRPALVLPILNCAVKLEITPQGNRATLALGPVAPRPQRMRKAEALLNENPLTDEIIRQAANLAQEEANPRDSVMRASREYRLQLIPTLVSEALHQAARRATAES